MIVFSFVVFVMGVFFSNAKVVILLYSEGLFYKNVTFFLFLYFSEFPYSYSVGGYFKGYCLIGL